MKKLLLPIAAFLLSTGVNAQTYFSDDFSSGNLNNWTLTNSDGDGFDWVIADYDDGAQEEHASSASWDGTAGVLTPDNWMVSTAIDLSAASGTINLDWKVYGQDQAYADENYTVYVGTSNSIVTLASSTTTFTEVVGTSAGYMSRTLDVSAFAGQTIYVAFRHHGVSDMFRLNIDDVKVKTPLNNDLLLSTVTVDNTSDGDRTFTIKCLNDGLNTVTAFDVDWSFDGGATSTENITGVNVAAGSTYDVVVNVNGVTPGVKGFNAEITTSDDDNSNNAFSASFTFVLPVPQFTGTDSNGNPFDLYDALGNGQAILLDFMASWCGPCESSTPEVSEWIQDNGSGSGIVQAIAISTESTDDDAVMNGLDWNGGFYHYPKFAYTAAGSALYSHYATMNNSNGIPLFVLICPDVNDPGHSTIIEMDAGYGAGMFTGQYNTSLNNCASATYTNSDGINQKGIVLENVSIYPNPANAEANVNITLSEAANVSVTIVNALGQTVYTNNLGDVNGEQLIKVNTTDLEEGIYFVQVSINGTVTTERFSVVK